MLIRRTPRFWTVSPRPAERDGAAVTEAEARAALRAFIAADELERWIAAQRWKAVQGG